MARIDATFLDLGYLDTLSAQDTFIHRLDPRAKVVTTLVFIITLVSFGKYEVSALLPFVIFPVALMTLGNLPASYLTKKLLLALPFALFVGMFNPLFDRAVIFTLGSVAVSGGWVSFASVLLRFVLTVTAALILLATTGFNGVCAALEKLGAPRVFAVQLLLLYRYLFVLTDEGGRMARARSLRSFGNSGMGIKAYGSLAGHLLLRTYERAQRVYLAMLARGFQGEFHTRRWLTLRGSDLVFVLGWSALFMFLRLYNLPQLVGGLLMGGIG